MALAKTILLISIGFLLVACSDDFSHDLPEILEVDGRAFALGVEPTNAAEELVARYLLHSITQDAQEISSILADGVTRVLEFESDVYPLLYVLNRIGVYSRSPFSFFDGISSDDIDLYEYNYVWADLLLLDSAGNSRSIRLTIVSGKANRDDPWLIHHHISRETDYFSVHRPSNTLRFNRVRALQDHSGFFAERPDENSERFIKIDE